MKLKSINVMVDIDINYIEELQYRTDLNWGSPLDFRLFKISYECNLNILLKSSSRNKMKQNRHNIKICPQKTIKHTHKQWIMAECEKDKSVKWCLKGRMFLEELRLWNKEEEEKFWLGTTRTGSREKRVSNSRLDKISSRCLKSFGFLHKWPPISSSKITLPLFIHNILIDQS